MRASSLFLAILVAVVRAEESCAPLHLIYARATGEPPGSVNAVAGTPSYRAAFDEAASKVPTKGFGAAGWALVTGLTKAIPGTTSYPVHYSVRLSHLLYQVLQYTLSLTYMDNRVLSI